MIVSDDTEECEAAALFAAMRARTVGAGLVIMRVAESTNFAYWQGMDDDMRTELTDAARFEAQELAKRVRTRVGIDAEIRILEGRAVSAIGQAVQDDPTIKVLVIAAGTGKGGPGPLVTHIGKGKPLASRPIAVTVVPGGLTDEELWEMGGGKEALEISAS